MTTLAQQHDCLVLDLDGTVYRGHLPTEGAVESLARSACPTYFVTNNASRSGAEVAAHLGALGFAVTTSDVITSAQSAAHLLAGRLPPHSRVLVVGTDALAGEIAAAGLSPVRLFADDPVAVVQGHDPRTGWAELAEAALAIRSGALWVATNTDRTLPTERGLVPGNGSMVAAVSAATDRVPEVAGKPSPLVIARALARGPFDAPLMVGDRLDTDIAGANAAGISSLLVLSGVSTSSDVIRAIPEQRPTYLAPDLRWLHRDAAVSLVAPQPGWHVRVDGHVATVTATGAASCSDELAVVRATAHAVWTAMTTDSALTVRAGDDTAAAALRRWSVPG